MELVGPTLLALQIEEILERHGRKTTKEKRQGKTQLCSQKASKSGCGTEVFHTGQVYLEADVAAVPG